jgi:hypothetical protein
MMREERMSLSARDDPEQSRLKIGRAGDKR